MSSKNITDTEKPFEDHVNRLLSATQKSTLGELGKALGYKGGNALTNWKQRGVDYNVVLKSYPTISVKYIEEGVGPPFIVDDIQAVNEKIASYESRKGAQPPSDTERDMLIGFLRDQAKSLSEGLDRLARLERKRSGDSGE